MAKELGLHFEGPFFFFTKELFAVLVVLRKRLDFGSKKKHHLNKVCSLTWLHKALFARHEIITLQVPHPTAVHQGGYCLS